MPAATRNLGRATCLLTAMLSTHAAICAEASQSAAATPSATAHEPAMTPLNPFAAPSTLPYHLPPFDRIHDDDYWPAFVAGMAAQRREIDAIAHASAAPSFDNTIVALERSGQLLQRVSSTFFNLRQSNSDDAMLKLETRITPALAAHQDAIHMNAALFARIDALYRKRTQLMLDPESMQLLTRYHTEFVRAGASLPAAQQRRLQTLNQQISTLNTRFSQNVLKSTRDSAVVVDQVAQLDGLSTQQIDAAAQAASDRGLHGKWLVALKNTTLQPLLAQLTNRDLRERIYRASINRSSGGANDNTQVISSLVRLRAERAHLLGFPNHAAYVLADESAADPQTARQMLLQIDVAAQRVLQQETADIQHAIDAETAAAVARQPGFKLQPWDWQYYAEKVGESKFAFDQEQVKPYFELDHVLKDGVFYAAHQLYGITFKERTDLPLYQNSVRAFEIFDNDGTAIGLFLADYYARDNKQGGAWESEFVARSSLLGLQTAFVNNLNIVKPPAGSPTLLTFDEVTTMFHEFGHGLESVFSTVRYPLLAGNNVAVDFVEYPSQFNEMWARDPGVVAHFAHQYQTGEAMPQNLLDQVLAAQKFNQGYLTSEYLQSALIDLSWYTTSAQQIPDAAHVMAFEAAALRDAGAAVAEVPPRYHSPYFLHVFADQYDAGYYGYLWSEVLARDTGEWMHDHGGLTRENGDYFREKILSRGRSEDAQLLFLDFYGSSPTVKPLLEYRGLQ